MPENLSRFLSRKEFSKETSLSLPTVDRYLRDGKIPSVRLEGRVLIPRSFVVDLETRAMSVRE